jgi:hypothetical protein
MADGKVPRLRLGDTAELLKGSKEYVEASRRLIALAERETAEVLERVAESRKIMAESRKLLKRPCDRIGLAKLIEGIATGQVEDTVEDTRDPAAPLTPQQRKASARRAAVARWGKRDS